MKEICLPFNNIAEKESAEVEVRLPGTGQSWHYRIVSVDLQKEEARGNASRIYQIQQYIANYDSNWELLQIMDNAEGSGYLHLLYREKS